MRVRIIFENKDKGAVVPFHHQYHLYRLFRGIIKKCGDEAMESYKQFNFSGLKGQTKVSKSGLHFYSNKITIVFSCSDKEFVDKIIQQIFEFELLKVRSLQLKPLYVEMENEVEFSESMEYICISPMILLETELFDDGAKEFIHPQTTDFSVRLKNTILERFPEFSKSDVFEFEPDHQYIERIESQGKKYSRIYPFYDQDIPYEVRGFTFPFHLKAPIELHQQIYNHGIGLYCDKGFGMVDMANVEPGNKTVTYFDGHFVS